jgi:hypothetical protein
VLLPPFTAQLLAPRAILLSPAAFLLSSPVVEPLSIEKDANVLTCTVSKIFFPVGLVQLQNPRTRLASGRPCAARRRQRVDFF